MTESKCKKDMPRNYHRPKAQVNTAALMSYPDRKFAHFVDLIVDEMRSICDIH